MIMTITEIAIIAKVSQPIAFERAPFVFSLSIFLSLTILIITKRIGTATTPLITAVYTNALIGFTPRKFIPKPSRANAYGEEAHAVSKYNEHSSFFYTRGAKGYEHREKKTCRQKVEQRKTTMIEYKHFKTC